MRAKARARDSAVKKTGREAAGGAGVAGVRARMGLTREQFGRLAGVSVRSLASWESGTGRPGTQARVRLKELERFCEALGAIVRPEAIGEWITTPNPAFEGFKPIELFERGEADRLWKMIHQFEGGSAA